MRAIWIVALALLVGCGSEVEQVEYLPSWTCTVQTQIRGSGTGGWGWEVRTWSLCGREGSDEEWVDSCADHASGMLYPERPECECKRRDVECWEPGAKAISERSFCGPLHGGGSTSKVICEDECVNLWLDANNCGRCGHVCRTGDVCRAGECLPCVGPPGRCRIVR